MRTDQVLNGTVSRYVSRIMSSGYRSPATSAAITTVFNSSRSSWDNSISSASRFSLSAMARVVLFGESVIQPQCACFEFETQNSPRNRNDILSLRQEPSKGKLARAYAALCCVLSKPVDNSEVLCKVLGLPAWHKATGVWFRQVCHRPNAPGEHPSTEGRVAEP